MEAFVIILVPAVALAIYLGARFGAGQSAQGVIETLDELEAYRDTLQKTALRAQLERWDSAMMDQLGDKLDDVERRIATTAGDKAGLSARP